MIEAVFLSRKHSYLFQNKIGGIGAPRRHVDFWFTEHKEQISRTAFWGETSAEKFNREWSSEKEVQLLCDPHWRAREPIYSGLNFSRILLRQKQGRVSPFMFPKAPIFGIRRGLFQRLRPHQCRLEIKVAGQGIVIAGKHSVHTIHRTPLTHPEDRHAFYGPRLSFANQPGAFEGSGHRSANGDHPPSAGAGLLPCLHGFAWYSVEFR